MAVIGKLLQRSFKLSKKIRRRYTSESMKQYKTLMRLLGAAEHTAFGRHYDFTTIFENENPAQAFAEKVPLTDYDGMHPWWKRAEDGEANVAWPGKVKYFALSSGTSGAPSKHIPVTREMLKSMHKAARKQFLSFPNFNLPAVTYEKRFLSLGGSTSLIPSGTHYKGDVSGINGKKIPRWFRIYYKPGVKVSRVKSWDDRLVLMTQKAPKWDVGIIAGVPAWAQILLERIIDEYSLETIHDLWPNLGVYIHGGVALTPYRENLDKLFGKPMVYMETYLASEGFFALQTRPDAKGMELMLNSGIFYEFLPFTDEYFTPEGQLRDPHAPTLLLDEVELGRSYALVISTCSGAWRYLIGDTVKVVNKAPVEIVIDGRIKHFLSMCGEHLSVDNMNTALVNTAQQFGLRTGEFTVAGIPFEGLFAHRWYIGCDAPPDHEAFRAALDAELGRLNDDYVVERRHALKEIQVVFLPEKAFVDYMALQGKVGAQNKFPRVLRGEALEKWMEYAGS